MAPRWRVAIVDDHQIVREGIVALLSSTGDIEIVAAAASVDELLATEADVDLVVLDLRLEDGSSPGANVEAIRAWGVGDPRADER